jgi:hypothetical protein
MKALNRDKPPALGAGNRAKPIEHGAGIFGVAMETNKERGRPTRVRW